MFEGGCAKSFSIFPMRIVYMPVEEETETETHPAEAETAPSVSILVSVSKRKFKRAVKRNRVKRQLREAYRKNKHLLADALPPNGQHIAIAFIYLADALKGSSEIENKMKTALTHIAEKLSR